MRKLFALLARPIVWSTGGLLLLLLALHVISPLIGIEEDKRWIIELLVGGPLALFLVGYWLRQLLIERRLTHDMATQAKRQAVQQGPDALRDFKAFSEEFTRAFAELNQQCRARGLLGGAGALPWIMLLGPSGVGKSTALERSGLRFTSLGRRLQGIGGTRNCTWWLADDAVFLDTAGRYAVRDEDRDEWRAFLHLLRRRRRRPIDAVLLQVGIDELLDRPRAEIERAALQLRERLDELVHLLDTQIPVHLLFNKCDLLDGFVEFFGGLDKDEQAQPWGFRLDTSQTGAQPLGQLFSQRFADLIRALTGRVTPRLLALPERETREAALGFPAELAALGATLSFFTETLFEPRARSEQPWLCAVYLGSAEQTGQRAPSLRQRRAEELALGGIRPRIGMAPLATGAGGETFFLRGVFAQVLRQAENAARPSAARLQRMQLHQRVAVGLAMAGCLGASLYLGGRYSGALRWMGRLEERAQKMQEAEDLPRDPARITKKAVHDEINRQDAVRALLEDAPSGVPSGPGISAMSLLRRRIDKEWLEPLKTQMQQDLEHARHQGSDPSEDFSRGFGVLRLAYVLRGNVCPGTDPELTRQSLSQYVIEHWQRALGERGSWLGVVSSDDENAEHPQTPRVRLRRGLELFFEQEPEALRNSVSLQFEDSLRDQTRQALVSSGDQALVVFNLRASLTNLYERRGQLSTPLFTETGIERVFTAPGCATFFGKEADRGSEWWKCVLDMPLPRDPPNLEDIYRHKYIESWNRWLHELALRSAPAKKEAGTSHRKDATPESVTDVIQTLDQLTRDARPALPQVLQTIGRGAGAQHAAAARRIGKLPWYSGCGKRFGKSIDWGKQAINSMKKEPQCERALDLVAPFAQLTSPAQGKPSEDEAEAGGAREDYQKYLATAKTLRATLYRIDKSTERNSEALKLVQATLVGTGDLWTLETARGELIASLQSSLSGSGFDINDSGLNSALRELEGQIFRALVPLAARALNEQWKNQVYTQWQTLKGNHVRLVVQDEDRCKERMEFMRKNVGDFVDKSLAVFYVGNSLTGCNLKRMSAPFDQPPPLPSSACERIRDAREVGNQITDCPKAIGQSGGGAKRDPLKADVAPPQTPGCQIAADEVLFDRGDKVFVCSQSTEICAESKQKSSQRGRLLVKWQNKYSYTSIYERDYPDELIQLGTTGGNKLTFRVPKTVAPGGCDGFVIRFTLAPAGAGGAPMPKGPDNRWRYVDLPGSLVP